MAIDYSDSRFTDVENEKQNQLNSVTNTYNQMINDTQSYYDNLQQEAENYATKQTELQQANTDLAIEQINQEKEKAQSDYQKEQKASYADYQKQLASNTATTMNAGLQNTGYSESSQVSMYNTYQNRVATAKESLNSAMVEYSNQIKEAQLANNSAIAEIAHNALQEKLELALEGFQYKNTLTETLVNQQQSINDTYYNRYQDVVSQINTENAFNESVREWEAEQAEAKREYEEQMAYQKERDAVEDAQWEKQYNESVREYNSSNTTSYPYYVDPTGNGSVDAYGNSTEIQSKDDYYFSNGYQPSYLNGQKLEKAGMTAAQLGGLNVTGSKNIWKGVDENGNTAYYVWVSKDEGYKQVSTESVNNYLTAQKQNAEELISKTNSALTSLVNNIFKAKKVSNILKK